jgi:putative NADH-flavin reductase
MKVVVFGAGGRLGTRIVRAAVATGHDVTAFVRNQQRLLTAVGPELYSKLQIVEGDALDAESVRKALSGQDAAVQTAGYIGSTYEEAKQLQVVIKSIVKVARDCLNGPRRIWVLGGAPALDLPGRGIMLVDVPGFPFMKYTIHKENYQYLCNEAGSLDWSFACPGVMFDAPEGTIADHNKVRITINEAPVQLPAWSQLLPNAALLPVVAAIKDQLSTASYEDIAAAIVANLGPGGPLSKQRVGFSKA